METVMGGSGQGSIREWRRLWMGAGTGVYVNGDGYGGSGQGSIREWRRLWVGVGKGVYVNGDGYGWEWAREYA